MKVICCNQECGRIMDEWKCVCFKHDREFLICPYCHEAVEKIINRKTQRIKFILRQIWDFIYPKSWAESEKIMREIIENDEDK